MSIPEEHVTFFDQHFPSVIRLLIAEDELLAKKSKLEDELLKLEATATLPPAEEVEGIRKKIMAVIDQQERDELQRLVSTNSWTNNLLHNLRHNAVISGRYLSRDILKDTAWIAEQVGHMTDWDSLRRLVSYALDVEKKKAAAGEIQDAHIPQERWEKKLKGLQRELAETIAALVDDRFTSAPMRHFSDAINKHRRRDAYRELLTEYLGHQREAAFPLEFRHRQKSHPAYGNITDRSSENYSSEVEVTDSDRLDAWRALGEHLGGITARKGVMA